MQIITKEISRLSTIPLKDKENYVVLALLRIHAVDDEHTVGEVADIAFHFEQNPVIENFIPYENLTETTVLSWCEKDTQQWESMIAFFENRFRSQKEQRPAQPEFKLPPWKNVATTQPENLDNPDLIQEIPNNTSLRILSEILGEFGPTTPESSPQQLLTSLIEQTVTKVLKDKNLLD